jgi:multidrug resistance efflux pump
MSTIKIRPHEEIVNPKSARKRRTLLLIFTPLVIFILFIVSTLIQVDDIVAAKGYVTSSEHAELRSLHVATLSSVAHDNHASVSKGQTLFELKPATQLDADTAEQIVDELIITSPLDGTLRLNQAIAEGQNVAQGQLLGEVFDHKRIVKLHIRQRYDNGLEVGQPVTFDIHDQTYTGSVTGISQTLESEDRYVYRVITCSVNSTDLTIGTSCVGLLVRGKTSLLNRLIRY